MFVNPIDDTELDRHLEDAVEPDAMSVERIVTGALNTTPRRQAFGTGLIAPAGVAVLLVALVLLNWPTGSRPPDPIRMRNVGDVILVDYPDGSRAVVGPAAAEPELFTGFDYVLVQGERQ
jgi:hypothetical protein